MVHDRLPTSGREHVAPETDQTPGGNLTFNVHPITTLLERLDFTTTRTQKFHGGTDMVLIHIQSQQLDRLAVDAVDLLLDDLRTADRQLIPFSAHVLQENAQMQEPASGDLEFVRGLARLDPEGEIASQLAIAVDRRSGLTSRTVPNCPHWASR